MGKRLSCCALTGWTSFRDSNSDFISTTDGCGSLPPSRGNISHLKHKQDMSFKHNTVKILKVNMKVIINAPSSLLKMLKKNYSNSEIPPIFHCIPSICRVLRVPTAVRVPVCSSPSHFLPLIFWISLELRISMPFLKRPIWPVGAAPKPEVAVFLSLVDVSASVWTNQRHFPNASAEL